MARKAKAHQTNLVVKGAAPAEIDAGSEVALKIKVACGAKCNLVGAQVSIVDDAGVVVRLVGLATFGERANETLEFSVKAPTKPGALQWTATFAQQEKQRILHEASSAPISLTVRPHAASLAVWDVPSPIVFGTPFKIRVGVRCTAGCNLAGTEVEIVDPAGTRVATGTLSETPWSAEGALYWTDLQLRAPDAEGYHTWEARFPEPALEMAHQGGSQPFGFRTARRPDHVVTVQVINQETSMPIRNADVLMHPYRGRTDERGMAEIAMPKGEYELYVTATDMRIYQATVTVGSDVVVRAELAVAPVEDT